MADVSDVCGERELFVWQESYLCAKRDMLPVAYLRTCKRERRCVRCVFCIAHSALEHTSIKRASKEACFTAKET